MADVATTASAASPANASLYQRPRMLPGGKDALHDDDKTVAFFAPTGNMWAQAVLSGQQNTAVAANDPAAKPGQAPSTQPQTAQAQLPGQPPLPGQLPPVAGNLPQGVPPAAVNLQSLGSQTGASGATDGKLGALNVKPGLNLGNPMYGFASGDSGNSSNPALAAASGSGGNPAMATSVSSATMPQLSPAAFDALIRTTGANPMAAVSGAQGQMPAAAQAPVQPPVQTQAANDSTAGQPRPRLTIVPANGTAPAQAAPAASVNTASAGSTSPSAAMVNATANRIHGFPAHSIGQPSPRAVPLSIYPKNSSSHALNAPVNTVPATTAPAAAAQTTTATTTSATTAPPAQASDYNDALRLMQSNLQKYQAMNMLGQNNPMGAAMVPGQSLNAYGKVEN